MKKLAVILLAIILLIVPMSISASAAGSINTFEQAVLDALNENVTIAEGKFFHVPDEYIAQAENFLKTIDMAENESKAILEKIADTKELVIENKITKTSDLKVLPHEVKKQILKNGEDAAAAVDAVLTYDGADVKVTYNGTPVFEDAPIVKVTGADVDYTAIILSVVGVVAVLVAAAFVACKKGLLAK